VDPRVLDLRWGLPTPRILAEVTDHLTAGGLVAMPTETVYGLGGLATRGPLRRLQKMKDRGPDKPFLLLIPSVEAVSQLRWVPWALELAKVFWPGALTLILEDPDRSFPQGVRSAEGGVAVRVSPHPLAQAVVNHLGGPLVSTSANTPGRPPALTGSEALSAVRELGADEGLWILDGGPLRPSDPSTIIDCTGSTPVVVREGAIPKNRLRCVLPKINEST
jgi:L-threonylcarbamoyladenylate synthase